MKTCFKCGKNKDLSEFYKHRKMADGYLNKCKECNKIDVRENYRKNIKHYKNYDQIRNQKRKGYIAKKNKEYAIKNPDVIKKARIKYLGRNQLKRAAHVIFRNAIRNGKVKKGLCQICKSKDVEGHHFDYTRPLNVIWLCNEHHNKIHWWLNWNRRNYGESRKEIRTRHTKKRT